MWLVVIVKNGYGFHYSGNTSCCGDTSICVSHMSQQSFSNLLCNKTVTVSMFTRKPAKEGCEDYVPEAMSLPAVGGGRPSIASPPTSSSSNQSARGYPLSNGSRQSSAESVAACSCSCAWAGWVVGIPPRPLWGWAGDSAAVSVPSSSSVQTNSSASSHLFLRR